MCYLNRTYRVLPTREGGRLVKRLIEHYNLDVILSVGYRVNSRAATHFRQWATQTLRTYVEQGYVLCEQFLLFAEATALADRSMTMDSLRDQLDRLLTLNNYPVFDGYKDYLRDEAVAHAERELRLYRRRKLIEASGSDYDPDALAYGEYR